MATRKAWPVALRFFFLWMTIAATGAMAQTTIRKGRKISPDGPKLVLLHAPKWIVPPNDLPVYVSVKAGEADLKEIVWSFESPPYGEIAFGAYRIKPGEEKEVSGHFTLSTFDAIRGGTLSNTQDLYVYIKILARDVDGRISRVGSFDITLDILAPKKFPPPKSNLRFARNFGVIEGRIVPPVSDASEVP
ncbi:MAG: hypothetical protein QGF68_05965 [Nitrospinota bacterium]|nr:hypothetical protein [Nitrospinota bacterium]